MWPLFDYLLMILLSGSVAALVSLAHNWSTTRDLYSLKCDVADLQDKVLVEIKKRASLTFREKKKDDAMLDAIVEQAKAAQPPQAPLPWWAKYSGPDKSVGTG